MSFMDRFKECSFWVKYTLFVLNFFVWIAGLCLVAIGVWARLQNAQLSSVDSLVTDPSLLLLGVGVIMFIISLFGCIGSVREHILLLKIFCLVVVIVFILEVIASILTFVFMEKVKGNLVQFMLNAIILYPDNTELQETMDYMQKRFECCGARDYDDWDFNGYYNCSSPSEFRCGVPMSCCRHPTSVQCGYHTRNQGKSYAAHYIYPIGCIHVLMKLFKDNLVVIGAAAFAVGIAELFAIILAYTLIKYIILEEKASRERSRLQDYRQNCYDTLGQTNMSAVAPSGEVYSLADEDVSISGGDNTSRRQSDK